MSLISIKVNWQLINFHFEWFRSEDSFRHRDLQAARKCPSKWNVQKDSHKQKAVAPDNMLTKVLTHSNLFTPQNNVMGPSTEYLAVFCSNNHKPAFIETRKLKTKINIDFI